MLALEWSDSNSLLILIGRDFSKLNDLDLQCEEWGAQAKCYTADLSSSEEATKISTIVSEEYVVDLIISNAGLTNSADEGKTEEWADIKRLLTVNLTSAIAIAHSVIRDMQKRN